MSRIKICLIINWLVSSQESRNSSLIKVPQLTHFEAKRKHLSINHTIGVIQSKKTSP
jgi:hypothetical protein